MTVNILTEHHLEFLSLTGGYTGSSESIYVKMPHFWKSHVAAQISVVLLQMQIRLGRATLWSVSSVYWLPAWLLL